MTTLADFLEEQALERQVNELNRVASLGDVHRPADQDLLDAAMQGRLAHVEVALARGASVDAVERRSGRTALMFAAENSHVEELKLLLKKGANVNLRNKHGDTALSYASETGSAPCLLALLKAGADIENVDVEGWTPLHEASRNGHREVVRELLQRGAKINATDLSGFTPLCWASKYGKDSCVKLLLDAGADANASNRAGFTPLQLATESNSTETVKLLLAGGAKAKTQNNEGVSAWQLARQRSGRIQSMINSAVASEAGTPGTSLTGPGASSSPSLGAFGLPVSISPTGKSASDRVGFFLSRAGSLPRANSLKEQAAAIEETRVMSAPAVQGGLGGAFAAAAAEEESVGEVTRHLDSVASACGGLGGFSISVTWPTDGAGATAGVDAQGVAVGTHTLRAPSIRQLAFIFHALQADNAEVYAQFVADTESARQEALRAALSEEEGRNAAMALLAITRQKARARRSVEDAELDLEEAELALAGAVKTQQMALAGSEAEAAAADDVRCKTAWRDRKAASLAAAQEMLRAAEGL